MTDNRCSTGCAGPCSQGRAPCPYRTPTDTSAPESHWLAIDALAAVLLVAVLAVVVISKG